MTLFSLSLRLIPAAQFFWTEPACSDPSPELQSHAASAGSAHAPGRARHAQQSAKHSSGTNADQPRKCTAVKHPNSNADQPADTDTEQLTESDAGDHFCNVWHG